MQGTLHETAAGRLDRVNDEEVLARIQGGDTDAFDCLFHRHRRLVFSVAIQILRWEAEAEDLTQDVFCEILRVSRSYDPARGSVRTWLRQYAYHRSLNRKRYLAMRYCFSAMGCAAPRDYEPAWLTGQASYGLQGLEWRIALREAIGRLPDRQRQTLEDALDLGLDLQGIAGQRSESYSNVRHYYYRGIRNLRRILSSHRR